MTSIAAQTVMTEATHKANKATKFIKVDRKMLAHLLIDHANMFHELREVGVDPEYPSEAGAKTN